MKHTFKFIMALFITGATLFSSCETIELEQIEDPNNLTPEQADPDLLLNSIQLAYAANMTVHNNTSEDLTRISYLFGRDYFAALTGNTLNASYSRLYSNLLVNTQAIALLNENPDVNLNFQEGVAQVMSGHALLLMVDFMGDIPFSEAVNPDEFPDPSLDPGASVYSAAISLINQGISNLNSVNNDDDAALITATDFFYDEDPSKWIKAANTIKLKAALTVEDYDTFDDIIDDDNFISSNEDDLQFQYGTNLLLPDARHPDYAADYTPSGANIYQSNWLMNYMIETEDPRRRYYFYRQTDCTPGAECNPDGNGETLSCSLETPPVHYVEGGFTYCYLPDGYWGRDHGDDDGTPPDNFLRTAVGVYPAGGRYDDDSFGGVGLGLGGGGAGIEPILLASFVDFWRAEVALQDGDEDDAEDFIEDGIEKSIAKVRSFGSLDSNADLDVGDDDDDIDDFIEDIVDDFDDADDDGKWNILAQQYWVAMYGGGAEAYNFYRRTGYPTTLQPNIEPMPGAFPRSFPYASGAVNANPNIAQKQDQTVRVFWDDNTNFLTFPPAQ